MKELQKIVYLNNNISYNTKQKEASDIMKIGVDIDNTLSNFNDTLLKDYLENDKKINNSGIVNKNVYIRKMFDWDTSYEEEYYKNNIERIAQFFKPIKDSSKYVKN